LLCRHHGCELEIPLYPPYRFLNGDYSVFDCGSMAFSAAHLKPLVRLCSSLPGEPHRTQLSGGSSAITGGRSPIQMDSLAPNQRYSDNGLGTQAFKRLQSRDST
jgi:hypothetical protein